MEGRQDLKLRTSRMLSGCHLELPKVKDQWLVGAHSSVTPLFSEWTRISFWVTLRLTSSISVFQDSIMLRSAMLPKESAPLQIGTWGSLSFLHWQTTHVRSWPRSRATAPSEKSCSCSRKAEPPIETRMCTWLLWHAKPWQPMEWLRQDRR